MSRLPIAVSALWLVVLAVPAPAADPVASIRLHNPTAWSEAMPVEVPVGRLATPGIVDWSKVRLVAEDGREVPFAIREGRPHWKASLLAPVTKPRAEDLLVFSWAAQPNAWSRIDVVLSEPDQTSAIREEAGKIVVAYANVRATIDPATAMLVQLEAFGKPWLKEPLTIALAKLTDAQGSREPLPAKVRQVSRSSNAALTELHFVLEAEGLALGLSYRIHAGGLVEIWSDERPWQGSSPWVGHAAQITLPLNGEASTLPLMVNRAPYYGFADFAEVVKHAAAVHRGAAGTLLELGEETTNGRRWNRRLYVTDKLGPKDPPDAWIELADQGLAVDPLPRVSPLGAKKIEIVYEPGNKIPAQTIAESLKPRGVEATCVEGAPDAGGAAISLALAAPGARPEIEDDGFAIDRRQSKSGSSDEPQIRITAGTRFGLMQAALAVAKHAASDSQRPAIPLVASNPAVAIRGAGFGGGDFEVDFPFGSEEEWRKTFDLLIASGMNTMTDLGMWSNWKMPVTYRYMPELHSEAADAYDEVSGAKFREVPEHRERGLRLMDYLHQRGVKVWLWLPVGCVPTTYGQKHPEAVSPGNKQCPCFTHPLYSQYLEAFLKELLETYPIDGIVMIRDDNGGLCSCERCKAAVAASPTKSAAWEQYLILYRWLKGAGFRGAIAVYPYHDPYRPALDPLLPADLEIVGHGSGAAVLARDYEHLAPMGDTWLDDLFAGFRVPSTARMRRLLADRSSYWLGGAVVGEELPWRSIGRFGWEPTATVNTLRYEQAVDQFGREHADAALRWAVAYERLWERNDLPMLPKEWMALEPARRQELLAQGMQELEAYRQRLAELRQAVGDGVQDDWFRQAALFGTYFGYHLGRLERFAEMYALVLDHPEALEQPQGLREKLLELHEDIYMLAKRLDQEAAEVPSNMLARVRAMGMTQPFKEWVTGYDASLEWALKIRQFAGKCQVAPVALKAGEPFVLKVELQNTGVCPWIAGVGHRLELGGDAAKLGLPAKWEFAEPPLVFGDRREVELRGVAPREAGEGSVKLTFWGPFRVPQVVAEQRVTLQWQ